MTTTEITITGTDLIDWGHRPGPHFAALLTQAALMAEGGAGRAAIRAALDAELPPPPPPQLPLRVPGEVPFHETIEAETEDERVNVEKVRETMRELMRVPTIDAGAVMPDACPAGPVGTIPVGGIVAARGAIHPGMHSADICCSVMITDLGHADPMAVLDAAQSVTHFGAGGRPEGARMPVDPALLEAFRANPFLNRERLLRAAESHMGTQGDGNHFLFVGRSRATGRTAMVTHHGSRGPGALLYKGGMEVADRFRQALSPETPHGNAWIPSETEEGRAYWEALQLIRVWTKANHEVLHDATLAALRADASDRFWNEHNFVFERDGLFLHGKGATPAFEGWAADATALTLIPLNMAQPVLVTRGRDAARGLGFSPHGAGRNVSRTEHKRRLGNETPAARLAKEAPGLDVRFHAGGIDASELPSSYKDADSVVRQIDHFGLAEVVDYIDPHGCIMAGDLPPFWKKKRR